MDLPLVVGLLVVPRDDVLAVARVGGHGRGSRVALSVLLRDPHHAAERRAGRAHTPAVHLLDVAAADRHFAGPGDEELARQRVEGDRGPRRLEAVVVVGALPRELRLAADRRAARGHAPHEDLVVAVGDLVSPGDEEPSSAVGHVEAVGFGVGTAERGHGEVVGPDLRQGRGVEALGAQLVAAEVAPVDPDDEELVAVGVIGDPRPLVVAVAARADAAGLPDRHRPAGRRPVPAEALGEDVLVEADCVGVDEHEPVAARVVDDVGVARLVVGAAVGADVGDAPLRPGRMAGGVEWPE